MAWIKGRSIRESPPDSSGQGLEAAIHPILKTNLKPPPCSSASHDTDFLYSCSLQADLCPPPNPPAQSHMLKNQPPVSQHKYVETGSVRR